MDIEGGWRGGGDLGLGSRNLERKGLGRGSHSVGGGVEKVKA